MNGIDLSFAHAAVVMPKEYTKLRIIQVGAGGTGSFAALAIAAPQNIAKVEAVFREEIEKLLKDGFAEDEVKIAKAAWMQLRQMQRSQDPALARRLVQNERFARNMMREAEIEKKVAGLSADAINQAVRRYIDPSQFSIFKAGDFKKASEAR